MARKVNEEVLYAVLNNSTSIVRTTVTCGGNTVVRSHIDDNNVKVSSVDLHGNYILRIERHPNGKNVVEFNNRGWATNITRDRINAVLYFLTGATLSIRKGTMFLDDDNKTAVKDDVWTRVTSYGEILEWNEDERLWISVK